MNSEKIAARLTRALTRAGFIACMKSKKIPRTQEEMAPLIEAYRRIGERAEKLGWIESVPKYKYDIPSGNSRKDRVCPVVYFTPEELEGELRLAEHFVKRC